MGRGAEKMMDDLVKNPRNLFLIDAAGAFLTAFLLFVVLRNFEEYIGIPETVLTGLSIIAVFFCIFSVSCFLVLDKKWAVFLRIIGVANLLYCVLTMGFVIAYYPALTILGVAYFLGEIGIVCALVYVELSVATRISSGNAHDIS
jgi:mannose/fructose/N-acetylgalactosamine-specific phosphotransferase system component IIC